MAPVLAGEFPKVKEYMDAFMLGLTVDKDLSLSLIEDRHVNSLFELTHRNRAYLRQWLPWVDGNKTAEDTRSFVKWVLMEFARGTGIHLATWERDQLVGVVGFHKINQRSRRAEIGYWLSEGAQGRGIVTRSCRVLIDHGFNSMNLNKVEILVAPDNTKSAAIPERLGLRKEGLIREAEWLNDRFVDNAVYGVLKSEWKKIP